MEIKFYIPDERANAMMDKAGLQTGDELINHAVSLFELALDTVSEGECLAAVNEEKEIYRVLKTPALLNAEASAFAAKLLFPGADSSILGPEEKRPSARNSEPEL